MFLVENEIETDVEFVSAADFYIGKNSSSSAKHMNFQAKMRFFLIAFSAGELYFAREYRVRLVDDAKE